jgi:hypothetical protein
MTSATAAVVILAAPWASSAGISHIWVGSMAGRFALLAALVAACQLGPMPALFTLLAVFTLLTERSHEVLSTLPTVATMPPVKKAPIGLVKEDPLFTVDPDMGHDMHPDVYDSNPRLEAGPSSADAPAFFQERNLA